MPLVLTVGRMGDSVELPSRWDKKKRYLAASVIIAVFVMGCISVGCGNVEPTASAGRSTGEYVEGVGVRQELMPTGPRGINMHVPDTQSVQYNFTPPASGDHWGAPVICGFYEDGLPDERIVHNLEHSNIVVSYNLASEGEVDQLKDALDAVGLSEIWGVTRAYDKVPSGVVALAAWGVLDTMQGVDDERIKMFFETYAGSNIGPENFNC